MHPLSQSLLCLIPALGLASAAQADNFGIFLHDPACSQIATVQFLDCKVDQIFSCPAPAGVVAPMFRDEVYSESGLGEIRQSDGDGWPVAQTDNGKSFILTADPVHFHGTSFDQVLKDGQGSYAGTADLISTVAKGKVQSQLEVRLTGKVVTMNGLTLKEVEVRGKTELPPPIGTDEGTSFAYAIPELRYAIDGERTGGTFYDPARVPHRPMSIALPGDDGFLTTKPAFCGPNVG